MNSTKSLRASTAACALLVALSSSPAFAQATIDTSVGNAEGITSAADYKAGNIQKLASSGSVTTTSTNNNVNVSITVSDTFSDTVSGLAPETGNLISVTSTGNASTAAAELLFAPSTSGDTAAVGTLQAVEADVSASSTNDTHSIIIENTGSGVRTLTGTALSDDNDITASATGNTATSTIEAAAGLDLDQANPAQASLDIDSTLAATVDNDVSGDLVVSSTQEFDPVEAGENLSVTSTVTGADTRILIEEPNSATVTLSNSDQESTAIGNSASSSIESLDTTAGITASTIISNLQVIATDFDSGEDTTTISATTSSSNIRVDAGEDSLGTGNRGDVANSTISVADNSQTASATGSVSAQSISLNASSITGEGAAATISDTDTTAVDLTLSADADSVIGNVQIIDALNAVSASVNNNNISSILSDNLGSDDVTSSTLEVTGNSQAASATGVSTTNTLSLTSGATMSAAGAVASAQAVDGSVTSTAQSNTILNSNSFGTDSAYTDLVDSTLSTTANVVSSTATGSRASNTLQTTSGTNNLSVASNTGTVQNGAAATSDQPTVTAGQALTNDQFMDGTGSVIASVLDNQIRSYVGEDVGASVLTTDDNVMSASATANTADNTVSLAFNALDGTISGAGTGVVAATANEQTLSDNSTITARNVGLNGFPIFTSVYSDAGDVQPGASVSTSGNTVSVSANGNVTTGNDVIADATNITSGSEADPSITTAGVLTATGSFVSASTQISGADILASQKNTADDESNTILTAFGDDIEDDSTVVSDDNVLSAVATANSASNSVQLGDAETATVAASGVTVNYQSTSAEGSISAEIGIAGTEAIAGFTSLNGATTPSTASDIDYASGTGTLTVTVNPVTVVFDSALTAEEALVLTNLGWTASSGSATVVIPVGTYNITGSLSSISVNDPSPGGGADTDETITIAGFNAAPVAGTLNGAGVLVRVDANDEGSITDSQVSVSDNTVVGEVNGNTAVNATFATATSIEGLGTTATSVNVEDTTTADPTGADLATTNVQASAAALSSDVDAVFGIVAEDGNGGTVARSSQTVSENLQQSYATANRATNSVDLTATNSDADTALDSIQSSNASVATTSDMEVLAEAASDTSSLALDGNTNQSVANGNVVGNAVTVDVTNASDGTAGGDNAGYTDPSDMVVTANNVLSSAQTVIASVTASAESDIYNQDATSTEGDPISDGDISLSGNATIAQATANSAASGNTMTLGDAGTANMDQTGFVYNFQSVQATALVTASVDQDVSVTLSNDGSVPVNSSSLSLDGNGTTALARSNVATNSLIVDGANIDAGDGTDADLNDIAEPSLDAAYVLFSLQENAGDVTATTTQSRVEVVLSDAGAGTTGARSGGGVLDSALSLSGNTSSATALANNVVNAVTIGANAANVDATAALDNNQVTTSAGPVLATGGSAVRVDVTVTGGSDPLGISGSTVMLSGNSSVSNATGNQSQNTLTASGANITSGGGDRAIVNSAVDATLNADAGNLLTNTQTNNATITSTNTANVVDISSDTAAGTVTPGSAVSGSTLAVMNNVTEARASANLSLNSSISIGGAGTASLDSTGMVGNFQTNNANATVSASASTATTIGLTAGADATALNGGTAMLTGNSTLALARGNVAENNVVADGANVTSGISPVSLNASTGPLTAALYASYGVFNEQQQLAAINAESQNTSYRVDLTGGTRTSGALGLALNAGSATVSGNSIDATSYGNIAINSVTLSSLSIAANDASAAVFNGQNNGGAIGATVSGATIGAYTTGGITNGSIGVSNNAINATSVGNFATSTVTRTDR